MKRFWKQAAVEPHEGGLAVTLDGRPVRTPRGLRLALPTPALAAAVAAEWLAVEGEVRPHAMPLTGLANAAIDIVAEDKAAFAASLARYAETDMLCYRAEYPAPLVERQETVWGPLIAWAEQHFDIVFKVGAGLMPFAQPPLVAERIGDAFAAHKPFALAALSPLVTLSGSVVIPLALAEGAIDAGEAWTAAILDELFQAEQWGEDALAVANRADRRHQFEAAARVLALAADTGGFESGDSARTGR